MKKLFSLLIVGIGIGQFSMGTISTGAIADYTYYKKYQFSRLDIEPELSYFATHNISIDFSTRIRKVTYDEAGLGEDYTSTDYGVSLSYYMPNFAYFGAGIAKDQLNSYSDDFYDMDYKIHSGVLVRASNNIFIDFRFWLETQDGTGFDGFSDERYEYGFDIGIKGFMTRF